MDAVDVENQELFNFANWREFAKAARIPLIDLTSSTTQYKTFSKYSKSQIVEFLSAPDRNEKQIRDASIYLYNVSSHYKRLINYFAKMPVYAYSLMPYKLNAQKVNQKTFYNAYLKATETLENLNMKHEFLKVLTTVFREDVFYGYEYSTKDSYYIQKLDADYCKISSVEDGCYCFAFDFQYFRTHEDMLDNYDQEFRTKYEAFKTNNNLRWQELDSKKTICIKVQEDLNYGLPPFCGVFPAIYDIEDYKSLMKVKSEVGNYKMLAMKIPMTNGTPDLDWEIAKQYFSQFSNVVPDYIGAVLTPMDIEPFNFEKSGSTQDSDEVAKAESQYWSSAGTNALLFGGGDNPTSSTLKISIKSDEEMVFSVLRQLERWVNRKLKNLSGVYKFKIQFLDVTVYNQDEKFNQYIKAAQYSLPFKLAAYSALGMSPFDVESMAYLENEALALQDKLIPLSSSYTQTGSSENDGGRPTNESLGKDLTDSGEETIETDANENR